MKLMELLRNDKVLHAAACCAVAVVTGTATLLAGGTTLSVTVAGFTAAMAAGAAKEYGDRCAAGNRWDWADIVADGVGAVLGGLVLFVALVI